MIIPVIDIDGKQIAWIDHLKLDTDATVYRHDHRLFAYSKDGTLQEIEIVPIDPDNLIAITPKDA